MVLDWPAAQLFEAAECLTSNQWRYGLWNAFQGFSHAVAPWVRLPPKIIKILAFFLDQNVSSIYIPRTDHDIRPYMSGITDARAMPAAGISSV
jgi:hypothetical protein